jgi:large subunit ribosomal protein L21
MRYAIVESGGKQYRAVEGLTLDVDRLPVEEGKKIDLERILMMADGDQVMVGTPTVSGIQVKATVLAHIRGPKLVSFRYRPKKRIRVKGGHRQQFTRLMVEFIGQPGEQRKVEKPAAKSAPPKPEKQSASRKEAPGARQPAKKAAARKSAPAKKAATKKSAKK